MGWLFRYVVLVALLSLLGLTMVGRAAYRYFASDLPDLDSVSAYRDQAPGVTRIHAADGTLLAELAREHRAYARLEDVPEPLIAAFLSAEDRRFYAHNGLDFRGLARAAKANVKSGTIVQGGSTITQQVAKSFLSDQERTLERKVREAILSLRMESRVGKAAILEIYLNKIFLGHGAYGVGAAASRYFDKQLDELTLAESALIAGLAQAPSRWSPVTNPELAQRRRDEVLFDMVEAGYLETSEAEAASAEPIVLAKLRDPFRWRAPFYAEHVRQVVGERLGPEAVLSDGLVIESGTNLVLQAAADHAVDHAARKLDRRQGWRGPVAHLSKPAARERLHARMLSEYGEQPFVAPERWLLGLVTELERYEAVVDLGAVEGSLLLRGANWAAPYDPRSGENDKTIGDLRRALEIGDVVWVRPHLNAEGELQRDDERGTFTLSLGQTPRVEGTLFTYDHGLGYVEAMAPGVDYDRSQYNRATQACRSPGSVFKAFYYALALDEGWQMDDVLEAKPWEPEPGEEWNPRNIDKTIDGKVLLRTALIKSLNTPSIRLFLAVGIQDVINFARKLGFTTELIADKGLSLGASCVHIDELTGAFAVFARGGSRRDPVYLRRVTDKHGQLRIDQRHPFDGAVDIAGRIDRMAALASDPPAQLVDPRTNFLISRLLREVVTSGTSTRANSIGAPAAGKSGTSSGHFMRDGRWDDLTTDTWFVGYTSRHATAAWMGFDDRNERSLGDEDASYTTAIPLWTDFMKAVVADRSHERVPPSTPQGIGTKIVDATHGGPPVPGMPQATIYYRFDLRRTPAEH
ncbi:Penicillin-binding protein 1A [Enhygromyxa salina]|uniref:Penicillin-binding protein 1A n=1 Tax=Enhygromyxa salina TaxID=215803 RepID=A0A2S9XCU6_9BACT|nr:PBP1A family penicillin-binding protein [Enhygromyxa salina]PRP90677.1 Penicillin-binding protein 1A [Enhygromyxa salina]